MADALSKWWDEDAERINKMAIAARKMAVKLPKQKEDRVDEKRAFCPNGKGNGVTNSCSSKQGEAASIDYDKLIDRIASSPDGFTLDVRNVEQPADGIMVSEFQNDSVRSMRINAATIRTASAAIKVREFINNNSDLLLGRNDRFLGGWLDGDDFYFDVATRFEPKDAEKALETGRKSGQLAVFNLATFNTTYIQYEPGDSRKPKDWDERFDRAKSDLGDQGQELQKHGKNTVRSIVFSESQDYICLDRETTSEQKHSESRHSGEGVEASGVSRFSSMGGEGRVGTRGHSRSGVVQGQSGGGSGTVRRPAEFRDGIDCGRGPGGIFGPGNKCQEEGSGPSDAFGNAIDGVMRSPSSTLGGGGRVDSGWKKSDEPSEYDSERLRSDPPSAALAGVNAVTILNGRALSASLKEVGVTLDQAASVCGNLSPGSNVTVAHGTLREINSYIGDPSLATDPESSVTVVTTQPFGEVEDAIGTAATLSRTDDDELLLSYAIFSVAPEVQRENPIAVARAMYSGVVKSINEAEKAGVEEVSMVAYGSDSNDEYKGYRIWPRLGFDGIIPRNRITPAYSLRLGFFESYGSSIPDDILSDRARQEKSEGALTIQALYETREGQRWWEENGGQMSMFLRVGDNEDTGWQRFKRISSKVSDRDIIDVLEVEWRAIHSEVESRAFCATGEGNGIDNSCGAKVMMAPDGGGGGGASSARTSPGAGKPASVTVESEESLDKAMSALGVGSVDDVVMLAGGNVRGAKVDVYGDESGFVKVSALWPIDRNDPRGGGKVFTEVSMGMTEDGKVLGFESFGPSGGSISSPADQQTVMSIISEKVAESIDSAEKNGFVAVTTFAVGDANNEYKGYRLWPQFGFDADLPRDLVKRIPPELILKSKGVAIPAPGSTSIPHDLVIKSLASQHRDLTIQELIKTREGKRWWDENGDDINLKLDLRDKESLGYKKWLDVKDRLPRLKSRNETRAFFDAWVEGRDCGQDALGRFSAGNDCADEDGTPTDAFGGEIGGFERTPSAAKAKKGGGSSGPEERGPLVWRSGEPHIDIFRESTENNPTTRDASGKVVATSIPGGVVTRALAGKYEVNPIAVGRYLMTRQAEERGRPISTREALEGDDFEYMVSAIADQARSAIARGVSPNFYSPEDRKSQLEEYSQLQPLMRGGRTASGICIGEEDAEGNCQGSEGIHPHAEFLFRAAQALTSPEANPYENMRRANEVLNSFFNEPDPKKARLGVAVDIAGASGDNIRSQLGRIQSIIDRIGLEETAKLFSGPPVRVGDLDEYFTSRIPNSDGEVFQQKDYAVDEYAPPFSIFGPKVGPFFANNMGDPEPLTADVWFTRTWGRLSGELIEKTSPDLAKKHATQLMEQTGNINRKLLAEIGQDGRTFRTDVAQMKKTGVIPQSVINWAEKQFKQAEKDGFPGPDKGTGTAERKRLDNLAKAIMKNQTRVLKAPSTTVMRTNMIRVMKEASARTGVPVAYLQDILWQDEQDAWGTLGSRTTTVPGEPSLYSTVIKKLVDDIKSGKSAKEEKPSRKKSKRSYDALDLGEEETGYLSDYKGGIEQALYDEAMHEVDDDTFADIAIEFLRRYQTESRSTLESAKELVIELRSAGLNTILMPNAGRDGLHVMGFDADIPRDLVDSLPESLSHCQTLLDLHVTGEGRSWWEQNGRDVDVTIDLDGVQGRIFDSFAAEKRWEDIIEEGILDDYGHS